MVKSLPNKCYEDINGLSYAIVKGGGDTLCHQLVRLFQLSLSTHSLPSDRKKSIIHPIKKKSNNSMISNFRPISISSCICRILERIIRDAIQSFLDANLLMNVSQQGFSRGRSTLTALLTYSNDICNAIDKGLCVDSAYFDFSKAFDCVRHDYLVYKLSKIGINGPILKWIINYLKGRTQVVNVNGEYSTERSVASGVIQGSVLGPILFSVFVNDLDEHIVSCKLLKYADDIRIYRCFEPNVLHKATNAVVFQNDMDALAVWSKKWDLNFNLAKC